MLQHKDRVILSEIKDFFTSSEKAMETIFSFISSLTFSDKRYGFSKACNLKYANHTKFILLMLFAFFEVKTSWHYVSWTLYRFLSCGKDVFYRIMNDAEIDWRNLSYSITMQLIRKTQKKSQVSTIGPRCLIVDDTDLPKTGRLIELIGRIYSHVTHSSKLGFKDLFMGYYDGKSFFSLDFSLHGEKGKNSRKHFDFLSGISPKGNQNALHN